MSREKSERILLSPLQTSRADVCVSATLAVETFGESFVDITDRLRRFVAEAGIAAGALTVFIRHTSASLTIQENADPDVLTDLATALQRLAPRDGGWIHDAEGPDDMPAHIRSMLTGTSLHIPVLAGRLALGTWQGVYVIEHRARPHRRELVLQAIGARPPDRP